eukprot:3528650-Rhodomonas_salina.2
MWAGGSTGEGVNATAGEMDESANDRHECLWRGLLFPDRGCNVTQTASDSTRRRVTRRSREGACGRTGVQLESGEKA